MTEFDFMYLLYLCDTPVYVKEVIEEILAEEREETRLNRLLIITSQ